MGRTKITVTVETPSSSGESTISYSLDIHASVDAIDLARELYQYRSSSVKPRLFACEKIGRRMSDELTRALAEKGILA